MLTSVRNPLVRLARQLHQSKGRRSAQQFLLEGTHLLREAIAQGYPLTVVCATPDWCDRHPDLWQRVCTQAQRWQVVGPEALGAMATTVNPDGVVAIAPQGTPLDRVPTRPSLGIAVDRLQDPANLGSLIRTGAAVGCEGLWLGGDSVDPYNPKVLRASAGQWFRMPLLPCGELTAQVAQWQGQGVQVVATAATATVPYWAVDWRSPTVVLLGNEGAGLSPALVERATMVVAIPMAAGVESLNVAIAAAILLFEAQRQRLTGS